METTGMMPIPIFEIVDVPQYIGSRTAYAVWVNGREVAVFPDQKSAEEWVKKIQNIIGIG